MQRRRVAQRSDRDRRLPPFGTLRETGGEGRASCRSLPGLDIFKALSACGDLLVKYGGHSLAAGFTIEKSNYKAFCERFFEYAASLPEMPVPELPLECELLPEEISLATAREVEKLEPCGSGNPSPLFLVSGAAVAGVTPLSGGKHDRMELAKGGCRFRAVLFNASRFSCLPRPDGVADFAVSLEVNRYGGTQSLTVNIRDIRPPAVFDEQRALYRRFLDGEPPAALDSGYFPVRSEFAAVFRYFRTVRDESIRPEEAFGAVREKAPGMNYFKMLLITGVFEETGLITVSRGEGFISVRVSEDKKVDLGNSALLKRLEVVISHG